MCYCAFLIYLCSSSLYLDEDIVDSINMPLVFVCDELKIKQWGFNEIKTVRLTECANSIGHWLADSTSPRSYTETDKSVICLDDIQFVELNTSTELNLTVAFL